MDHLNVYNAPFRTSNNKLQQIHQKHDSQRFSVPNVSSGKDGSKINMR